MHTQYSEISESVEKILMKNNFESGRILRDAEDGLKM